MPKSIAMIDSDTAKKVSLIAILILPPKSIADIDRDILRKYCDIPEHQAVAYVEEAGRAL
jgi:hypothetical protein